MHLLIPFASAASEVATQVLHDLTLPSLAQLLQQLTPAHRDEADETTLSPPHERALARAWGWHGADGTLPFAARAALADGIDVGAHAWGLLTPCHWLAGRDRVTMLDPDALQLDAAESRALFEAVRPLFEDDGFEFVWGAPQRWYIAHPDLADLPCASLDRVIGRNVDTWQPPSIAGRRLRRLQSEVQLAFYPHPTNEAREARDALSVNSFWLSGCGVHQPVPTNDVKFHDGLRQPLLAADWSAWADAWRALDGGALRQLAGAHAAGAPTTLTLCGERHAATWTTQPLSLWQRAARRWRAAPVHEVLESL
jgi:hypothetical protein